MVFVPVFVTDTVGVSALVEASADGELVLVCEDSVSFKNPGKSSTMSKNFLCNSEHRNVGHSNKNKLSDVDEIPAN